MASREKTDVAVKRSEVRILKEEQIEALLKACERCSQTIRGQDTESRGARQLGRSRGLVAVKRSEVRILKAYAAHGGIL